MHADKKTVRVYFVLKTDKKISIAITNFDIKNVTRIYERNITFVINYDITVRSYLSIIH